MYSDPPTDFDYSTLDAFHVVLLVLFYYHYTVTNFGDYTSLLHITW